MIYLDSAATARIYPELTEVINNYNVQSFFNPSARYKQAAGVQQDIKDARAGILKLMGGRTEDNFIFCSGGTEANNLALKGALRKKGERIIVSASEHPSVYNTALELKSDGYDVVFIDVNKNGSADIDNLTAALNDNTRLVSIMHVNNETGAINNLKTISQIIKSRTKALFHADGVQAFGKIPVNMAELGTDIYTVSSHKIHGPKGIAGLFVKNGIHLNAEISGGGQENNVRSGTENVSGIIAFSNAASIINKRINDNTKKYFIFKEHIVTGMNSIDFINNSSDNSAPHILNLSIKNIKGEVLLQLLGENNILISTGSACSTKKGISRIPSALGLPKEYTEGTIRISFDEYITFDDIKFFTEQINYHINSLLKYKRK